MSDTDAILFANETFYRAFADKDMETMADLWSRDNPVSCLHPGWGPLFDRSEVISSWAAILNAPEAPDIRCVNPTVHLFQDLGTVICFEQLEAGLMVATNVFVREGSLWKMVHHQGAPTSADLPAEETSTGGSIH
ncbi:MAG: nuclear transport factor 2 family protein [Rhodospirillaceae bacterium]|nr:nuclear transport factor 2 family protein [Rhodospirillaceae bacterium]MBT5455148.1 nuclear transport factor 2 family protein [Rhodospirillaceae bacterium]